MFKVLLFSWATITIVLIVLLVWYLSKWFKAISAKQNIIQDMSINIADDMAESVEETSFEEDVVKDQEEDIVQDFMDLQEEEDITPSTIEIVEFVEIEPEIELAIEPEEVVYVEEIYDEPAEESIEENSNTETEENENITDVENAASSLIETPLEEGVGTQAEPVVEQSLHHHESTAKKVSVPYIATNSTIPEAPKDYDASRNIAQGHSRDDIVRDKFDKHLQKIRYEAGILKQRNDMLGYEKKLVEGLTLLPSDKDFQKQLADLYFHQGKYKKSLSLVKKILIDTPEDHYALWQAGEIALTEGHTEDAFVHFQQAYSYCEDNPKYCFSLAQRYYDANDLEQSLALMEKMVKLRPKSIEYLVSLSHVQHKMGLREQAKQSLLRALELDPMNITIKQYLKSL